MKTDKKLFILLETALAVIVIVIISFMAIGKSENDPDKISVIVQNSDDNQWTSFKYGLKMAAKDQNIEMFVVSTGGTLNAEEMKRVIEWEIDNGADSVIVQPASDTDMEEILTKIGKKVPVMLVEHTASKDRASSRLPTTEPDNYAMGKTLAEELLKDYSGNMEGKTIGLLSETDDTEALINRERGVRDALKDTGAEIRWSVSDSFTEADKDPLKIQAEVDFVIALDDNSLTAAGGYSAANNLHGALVYGIGHSTEAVYYLDTGIVQCLVVPDEFNVGYQSLTEVTKGLRDFFHKVEDKTVSYTVIRRDTLFSKENQEILFTMSQ